MSQRFPAQALVVTLAQLRNRCGPTPVRLNLHRLRRDPEFNQKLALDGHFMDGTRPYASFPQKPVKAPNK